MGKILNYLLIREQYHRLDQHAEFLYTHWQRKTAGVLHKIHSNSYKTSPVLITCTERHRNDKVLNGTVSLHLNFLAVCYLEALMQDRCAQRKQDGAMTFRFCWLGWRTSAEEAARGMVPSAGLSCLVHPTLFTTRRLHSAPRRAQGTLFPPPLCRSSHCVFGSY